MIRRTPEAPGTFDGTGCLRIGPCGAQPGLGEAYISTGSLYLCSTAFLPLGRPDTSPFWSLPDEALTSAQVWNGHDIAPDSALGAA